MGSLEFSLKGVGFQSKTAEIVMYIACLRKSSLHVSGIEFV